MTFPTEMAMAKKRGSFPAGAVRKYQISAMAITRWREQLRFGDLVEKPKAKEKEV